MRPDCCDLKRRGWFADLIFIKKNLDKNGAVALDEYSCAVTPSIRRAGNRLFVLSLDSEINIAGLSPRAAGYQGYAVYRDGVAVIEWHAGLMNEASSTEKSCVSHAPGGGETTELASWSKFMDGDTFKGVYRPKSTITSAGRDKVVALAARVVAERVEYTLYQQILYDATIPMNTKVEPSGINYIRCDGMVEYVYEYHGYAIYGGNIAIKNTDTLLEHSTAQITPKAQAQKYMTLITTSRP